jgi:hypothetical protein
MAKMATFYQQGQVVTYQFNGDKFNFGGVTNQIDLARETAKLSAELSRAKELNAIDPAIASQAIDAVNQASAILESPAPEKNKIVALLETAGNLVKGAAALGGLYLAVEKAIEIAHAIL